MPRPSKGPRIELQKPSDGRKPTWVIRDGQRTLGTGCDERDRGRAERKLAAYILKKHDPQKAISKSDPNGIKIADALAVEIIRINKSSMPDDRKRELITVCQNMGNWFGNRTVGDLDGDLQEEYAAKRKAFVMKKVDGKRVVVMTDTPAPSAAYRDLKILAAAVNRHIKTKVGGVQAKFRPVLPAPSKARERWLTRSEAARMIWAAWRARQKSTVPGRRGQLTARHVARYILVGVYTGSRNGDICNAAVMPTIGRGYVDVDTGIFKRKPDNKEETSKKQPTVPIPPRLLAHIRRWKRLGISRHSVIEWQGRPVSVVKEAWATTVKGAGLETTVKEHKVLRHTLRHTAITWYLTPDRRTGKAVDIETVSLYCGVSVATIRKTYRHVMPGTFDPLLSAAQTFGR
jgi:integrase